MNSVVGVCVHLDELKKILLNRFQDLPVQHIEGYVDGLFVALSAISDEADQVASIREAYRNLEARLDFSYVNKACEYSLASSFRRSYSDCFQYQVDTLTLASPPDRGRGSFDFRFHSEKTPYNVEVKSFSRSHQTDDESQPVKIFLPREQCQALYDAGLRSEGTCRRTLIGFLDKANKQLPPSGRGVNVVVVCCNDVDEYADALECLSGNYGIARDEEMIVKYSNVDAVVLTLTGLLHFSAIDPDVLSKTLQEEDALPPDDFDFWAYAPALPLGVLFSRDRGGGIEDDFKRVFQLANDHLLRYIENSPGDLQGAVFAFFNATLGRLLSMIPVESSSLRDPT
ncbi:TPA: hypothetical protein ACGRQA_001995 [Stenotrophomonas maltophilia]